MQVTYHNFFIDCLSQNTCDNIHIILNHVFACVSPTETIAAKLHSTNVQNDTSKRYAYETQHSNLFLLIQCLGETYYSTNVYSNF